MSFNGNPEEDLFSLFAHDKVTLKKMHTADFVTKDTRLPMSTWDLDFVKKTNLEVGMHPS